MRQVLDGHNSSKDAPDISVLVSKLPRWNARSETYELPFKGRAQLSSARNFQAVDNYSRERIVLLYGKMEEEEFSLDFQYPMSPLLAFAVALSTCGW